VELVLLLIYTPRNLFFQLWGLSFYWESHSRGIISSMMHSRQWWLRRCSSLTGSSKCENSRRMLLPTDNRAMSWEFDSTSNSRAWSPWWRDRTNLQNKTSSASADGPRDALCAELCYLDLLWIWCAACYGANPQQSATNPQQVYSKPNAYNK